jgi:hypothetical protein
MGGFLSLRRERIEPHRQRIELRLPIAAVTVDPQRRLEDRARVEPAAFDPTGALLGHQAGADQHLDVARHRLQRDRERRRQLSDQQIFAIELVEYLTPDRIGKRAEHQVKGPFCGLDGIHGAMVTRVEAMINNIVE